MPETPPFDRQPDPAAFGVPTNRAPAVAAPDPHPADPDRERKVSDGATHVVLADSLGGLDGWVRGDMIHGDDLPDGGHSLDTLMALKPYPAVRPMDDDDRRAADDHRQAKAEYLASLKQPSRPKVPGPVKLTDPPKGDDKKDK